MGAPLATDLFKETLKVGGLPVAARPVFHALVEDGYAGVELTLALIYRGVVAVETLHKYYGYGTEFLISDNIETKFNIGIIYTPIYYAKIKLTENLL